MEQEKFLSILKYYVDLNYSIDILDPVPAWLPLNRHHRPDSFFDLEIKYGLTRKFDQTENPHFRKAYGENLSIIGQYLDLDFYDLFVPVSPNRKCVAMLLSGVFVTESWTRLKLEKNWTKISRRAASPENPAYMEFIRIALDTPVLEGVVLQAYQEASGIYAQMLAGEGRDGEGKRLEELKLKIFSKQLPHHYWLDWALGNQYIMPTWNRKVAEIDWVRDEIGITRLPTTVITVIPVKPPARMADPVEERLQVNRLQRRSYHLAKTLPQTVGGKLENYGAVFVTSGDPAKNRIERRKQIEDAARRIHRFAVGTLGGPALVGVGETVIPGESLNRSFQQAVLALHLGSHSGKEIVFFSPGPQAKTEGLPELRRLLSNLTRQFASSSFSDLEIARDGFLKQVLTLSFQNPEEIRWHFQYALIQLVEATRRQVEVAEKEINELHESLSAALEKAGTTQEMVLAFQDSLRKLAQYTEKPGTLKAADSIEKARDYIRGHFQEPLRISKLAKISKISTSTFSRRFKKLTGVGLEIYLQSLRLEEARRLLKTGSLPIYKVAFMCGFKSVPHFIQMFHRKMGVPPQKFRRKFLDA